MARSEPEAMRNLLLLLCLLICATPLWSEELKPVDTTGGVLRFELGQVQIPTGTKWKTRANEKLVVYAGARENGPPAVFMISVLHETMSPGPNPTAEMQEFAEGLADSYARPQGGLQGSVTSQAAKQGCSFSFQLKSGPMVYGSMLMGASDTLVFNSQGATREELDKLVSSFQPDPGKMAPPQSLSEKRRSSLTAIAWFFGALNMALGLVAGLVSLALRRNYWRTAANTMTLFSALEFVAGAAFISSHSSQGAYSSGEMLGRLMGGMLISCGLPIVIASRISRRPQ